MGGVLEASSIAWLVGLALSVLCLLFQLFSYVFVPASRKVDLKILTQITIARIVYVVAEYVLYNIEMSVPVLAVDFLFYTYSDAALVCWMFVFSKNLYDKITQVFTTKKVSFLTTSILVWSFTLPIGLLCPIMLYIHSDGDFYEFQYFYWVYSITKLIVLTVNIIFFIRIFYIAIKRNVSARSTGAVRACVIAFILLSISSAQVFVTDFVSTMLPELEYVSKALCVINAYQVLAVTAIFVILVRKLTEERYCLTVSKSFSNIRLRR